MLCITNHIIIATFPRLFKKENIICYVCSVIAQMGWLNATSNIEAGLFSSGLLIITPAEMKIKLGNVYFCIYFCLPNSFKTVYKIHTESYLLLCGCWASKECDRSSPDNPKAWLAVHLRTLKFLQGGIKKKRHPSILKLRLCKKLYESV